MQNNTSLWLGIGIVIALIIVGGLFFFGPRTATAPGSTATTSPTGSTTTVDLGGGITAQVPNGTTITSVDSGPQAPNLDHQTSYSPSLSADAEASLKLDIASTTASLKKNPLQVDQWLELALDYKEAGDYTAAANVWVYLTQVAPMSYIAFANLGDLYQNFEINYPKAEANFLAAIKLNPTDADYYANLYNIYRYHDDNTAAANAIVSQGLKANPGNSELLALQSQE